MLDGLTDGSLTLTSVTLLSPHLTPANYRDVLTEAGHKSKREVEQIVARLRPQPEVPATVRKLPQQKATDSPGMPLPAGRTSIQSDATPVSASPTPRPAVATPLAPERYKVQLTVSRETHDKLRRARDLLRHAIPNGDPAAIIDRALTLLVADLERASSPRPDRVREGLVNPRRLLRRFETGASA